jgi:hypothetical protein
VVIRVVVPVRPQWAVAHRWVEDRGSRFLAPVVVPAEADPVVVPAEADPVVVPAEADPVVVPVARPVVVPAVGPAAVVVHHAARDVVGVAVRNSSRWTCRPTRRMTPPCPRARL